MADCNTSISEYRQSMLLASASNMKDCWNSSRLLGPSCTISAYVAPPLLCYFGECAHHSQYIPGIQQTANPYGFGQPSDIPDTYDQLSVYTALLAVAYAEWLGNWTFPEDDERYGMSTLAQTAAWNDAHNDTTGSLGNSTW